MQVKLRLLQGESAEMAELQRVFEASPQYFERVTGVPPGPAEAQSTYSVLPEDKSYDDKFVFGIYVDERMIGCADVIRGYPDPATGFIGLLLVAEPFQRRGFGTIAYQQVEQEIARWNCSRARLALVEVNDRVRTFWLKLGFRPTGEKKPYRYGSVVSESIFFEKPLAAN